LNVPVISAYSIKSRLAGLCGLDEKTLQTSALHLRPCGAIHTFYLKTAIDVMFLDSEGRLLSHQIGVPPNKILLSSRKAQSVLEARTGVLSLDQFQEGDYIAIVPEAVSKPHWSSFRSLLHLPVNLFMAVFWFRFVLISFYNVLQSGSWFGLGLLLFNSLLVFFFLTRRISSDTSARLSDWLVAWSTVILSMSLKPHPAGDPALQMISLGLQAVGLSVMLYSLLSLGKSFGIVPANRSIILSGAYAWIRHPLYASEMVFYAGFLFGNPTVLNSLSIFVILLGQLWRVRAEENLLVKDIQYREYCLRVPYRFIPKLF
jgi:protein-S-isoprenylcysteine O-methyltransferase Ste14